MKWKKATGRPEVLGKEQTDKTTQLQIHGTLHEKGKMTQRAEVKITEDYFQPLKSNGVYPAGFQKYLFLSSHFLSLEWKCLSCYLVLVLPS